MSSLEPAAVPANASRGARARGRGARSRLAIHGGTPVVAPGEIVEHWPLVSEDDVAAVTATLRSGRLSWINDDAVPALERQWAEFVGARHCIAFNSGTAALHAAVAAAGVEPGDEVVVPALTFLASASAVIHHQGLPVFVDIDPETYTLDPALLEERITGRTRAVVAVHLHGLPVDLDPVLATAGRRGIKVIEDVAQAPGALYRGRMVGGIGDMGATSVMAGKNLATAGEGGLFTTGDAALRDAADLVKMFGERVRPDQTREYNAVTMGWNYRFSSILAAFTASQLRRLPGLTAAVQEGARYLSAGLAEIPGLVPPHVPAGRTHVYHHFRFRIDPAAAGLDLPVGRCRKAVQDLMAAEGVPLIEYQNRPVPGQLLFQQRRGYGKGCPWSCGHAGREIRYDIHDYPRTLDVIRGTLLVGHRLCMASFLERANLDLYLAAFRKVFSHRDELVAYGRALDYREPWEESVRLW
ncbi:MAG TPA: DegT/DnrJ/EryC1/StrS family aminotransferase [Thermoanaerobaculia bacterium]|nr:DegT/DnrJ/EryC1/StrS family aminotransferase [Thermoanaerobaculia bacterium]